MTRLALHGGLMSGKSTLAAALERRGYAYVNYTQYLKVLAARALSHILREPVTVEMIEAEKEKYRPFLIALGSLVGFDQGNYVEECLTAQTADHREVAGGLPQNIVFDNVRFPAQFTKLAPYGFRLVRLTTPLGVRSARAAVNGLTMQQFMDRIADKSEAELPPTPGEIALSVDGPMHTVLDHLTAALLNAERSVASFETFDAFRFCS